MRALIATIICLLVLPASGEETTVYKHVRPDGTIEFSDTAVPGGEKMKVPPVPTYQAAPLPKPAPKEEEAPAAQLRYQQIAITAPSQDSTIFFDEKGMAVSVEVKPGLKKGDVVTLYLDGQRVASGPGTGFTLKDVFRGSHTLTAAVEGRKREELLRSQPVTFNLVQRSVHTQQPSTAPNNQSGNPYNLSNPYNPGKPKPP